MNFEKPQRSPEEVKKYLTENPEHVKIFSREEIVAAIREELKDDPEKLKKALEIFEDKK